MLLLRRRKWCRRRLRRHVRNVNRTRFITEMAMVIACLSSLILRGTFADALDVQDQRQGAIESGDVDPEAALRYGYHVLRSHGNRDGTLSNFGTLVSGSGFPVGETLYLLGRAHDEGREDIGIERNETVARQLYEHAAKLGHPGSQHALSVLLASSAEGGGEVEAILYDFFASLGGDTLAHAALGYRYLFGLGTVQNYAQSLQHYLAAAKETIADLHSEGRGGIPRPVDRTRLADRFVAGRRPASDIDREAAEFWRAAADAGDVGAMRHIGQLYQSGSRGLEQDLEKAYRYFAEGAHRNDLYLTAYAGDALMRGAGVAVDYDRALKHFMRSKATSVSLNGLGYLYYHGLGVPQNTIQAYDYFVRAHRDKNDPVTQAESIYNIGLIYLGEKLVDEDGDSLQITGSTEGGDLITLDRDPEQALKLFTAAASLGHLEAAFHVALMYADAEPLTVGKCQLAVASLKSVVERGPWMEAMKVALHRATAGDYGGALVLYARLAEIGSEVAQSNAAWLLESGQCSGAFMNGTQVGCEKRALRLYEHAARQGRGSAEVKVGDFHYHGKAGLDVDHEKAAQRYLKAGEAHHAEALFNMGFLHQMGRGVPQDFFLAKRYFDAAALANSDAIPVARISLFLLRWHSWWVRWRDWWRQLEETDSGRGTSGEVSSPKSDTLLLLGLVLMLTAVLAEQTRRRRRRNRAQPAEALR